MKVSDFDFILPEQLIAQFPLERREDSNLMVVNKESGNIEERKFSDITDYLSNNDVLVINNTKVLPARLKGIKTDTLANIEILLLKELKKNVWEVLAKPAKRVNLGSKIRFGEKLSATCLEVHIDGIRILEFEYAGVFLEILDSIGALPTPPYIRSILKDKSRYQTVYAKAIGSVAAPTAGFHFTEELLNKIRDKNIEIIEITLHIGLGTFRPVSVTEVDKHIMHSEQYYLDELAVQKLNNAIKMRKRIIAVGTTSLRTLESNYDKEFKSGHFETDIFIYPGYKFKVVDALITNFHLPKSTLIMLVSAFSSMEIIKKAYNLAIKHNYRFFSFGDAMFISK